MPNIRFTSRMSTSGSKNRQRPYRREQQQYETISSSIHHTNLFYNLEFVSVHTFNKSFRPLLKYFNIGLEDALTIINKDRYDPAYLNQQEPYMLLFNLEIFKQNINRIEKEFVARVDFKTKLELTILLNKINLRGYYDPRYLIHSRIFSSTSASTSTSTTTTTTTTSTNAQEEEEVSRVQQPIPPLHSPSARSLMSRPLARITPLPPRSPSPLPENNEVEETYHSHLTDDVDNDEVDEEESDGGGSYYMPSSPSSVEVINVDNNITIRNMG